MSKHPAEPRCNDLESVGFDSKKVADETWGALLSADVFVEGEFSFASGLQATLKVDAEKLYSHPQQLAVILGHFATYPCVQDADVLLYVPEGMRQFVRLLGAELNTLVVETVRRPEATSKYDFAFASEADRELALFATAPVICEDVVTTLGSVAATRKLLHPEQCVHSLAILRRGSVDPAYQVDLIDHYLLEREIPTDKDEFRRLTSPRGEAV